MAENLIICTKNQVDYLSIRMAMVKGARTKEELAEFSGVCLECEGCKEKLDDILSSVCGCMKVSLKTVLEAVRNGAKTSEEVGKITGAGTDCGKCKILIDSIIKLGR